LSSAKFTNTTLRRIGGAPTYLLTDNPRTVAMDRIAGAPARHPDIVSAGGYYGCIVHTREPFDPESKGGAGHTVKIAKADLVPTEESRLEEYPSFAELAAFDRWCEKINARPHREVGAAPAERLAAELGRLHGLPDDPHLLTRWRTPRRLRSDRQLRQRAALDPGRAPRGEGVVPGHRRRTGSRRPHGHRCRRDRPPSSPPRGTRGSSTRITRITEMTDRCCACPNPARTPAAEIDVLALCEGAHRWMTEPAAGGVVQIRHKMARAVEFAPVLDAARVDQALALAAAAGRFGDGDLASILDHLAAAEQPGPMVVVEDPLHATWHHRMRAGGRTNSNSVPPFPDELAKICTRMRLMQSVQLPEHGRCAQAAPRIDSACTLRRQRHRRRVAVSVRRRRPTCRAFHINRRYATPSPHSTHS